MSICIVLVTAPSAGVAKKLAEEAVSSKLAACASIIPEITSVYYWDEKINKDEESQIIFKTAKKLVPELENFIIKNHPYECPEFIVLDSSHVEKKYASWLASSLADTLTPDSPVPDIKKERSPHKP